MRGHPSPAEHPHIPPERLDPFALDEQLRSLVRELQAIDARMGRALRRFLDLRFHRSLGFESFERYVRERLSMSPTRARALVAIERRAASLPELRQAYGSGELSWVRALVILPVLNGSHASSWIRRASEVTVRRLSDEVEWAVDMRDATGVSSVAPPEAGAALVSPEPQICAHVDGEPCDRRVTFYGPASVVALFRSAVAAFTDRDPSWRGSERLLLHAIAEWEAQPRHRDPIFARGGWRCAVPACGSRRNLHDHHVRFRSRGGGNERDNRLPVCAWHHLRGIHAGLVRASGRAPDRIVWQLGLRPGRQPLLLLRGERYLAAL